MFEFISDKLRELLTPNADPLKEEERVQTLARSLEASRTRAQLPPDKSNFMWRSGGWTMTNGEATATCSVSPLGQSPKVHTIKVAHGEQVLRAHQVQNFDDAWLAPDGSLAVMMRDPSAIPPDRTLQVFPADVDGHFDIPQANMLAWFEFLTDSTVASVHYISGPYRRHHVQVVDVATRSGEDIELITDGLTTFDFAIRALTWEGDTISVERFAGRQGVEIPPVQFLVKDEQPVWKTNPPEVLAALLAQDVAFSPNAAISIAEDWVSGNGVQDERAELGAQLLEALEAVDADPTELVQDSTRARALRRAGEIKLAQDLSAEALTLFERALARDPKVGLKRQVASLRKQLA